MIVILLFSHLVIPYIISIIANKHIVTIDSLLELSIVDKGLKLLLLIQVGVYTHLAHLALVLTLHHWLVCILILFVFRIVVLLIHIREKVVRLRVLDHAVGMLSILVKHTIVRHHFLLLPSKGGVWRLKLLLVVHLLVAILILLGHILNSAIHLLKLWGIVRRVLWILALNIAAMVLHVHLRNSLSSICIDIFATRTHHVFLWVSLRHFASATRR